MIRKKRARNSFSNKKSSKEADKKLATRNKTECKGFLLIITSEALISNNAHIKYVKKIILCQRQDLNLQTLGHEPNMLTNALP